MSARSLTSDPASTALCLGGLDPSAGAGLLRDVLVLGGLGLHPMILSLADTLQNGEGCRSIRPPAQDPLEGLEVLAPHLRGHWGLKLGMCALPPERLRPLLDRLEALAPAVRIWDPVQAPSLGAGLHGAGGLRRLAAEILPRGGWVVSPNLPELEALAEGRGPQALLDSGARAVWVKGGHAEGGTVEDHWFDVSGDTPLGAHPRLEGERRGTGCFLASAWLGFRLRGLDEVEAAREAASHLRRAWVQPRRPGDRGRPCLSPEAR